MKRTLLALMMVILWLCTGCVRLPGEEYAFVLALLVDREDAGWVACARIPSYREEGDYSTLTGTGESLEAALRQLNDAAPMRLHYGQVRTVILGPRLLAQEAPDEVLLQLLKSDLRGDAVPLACSGEVRELARRLVPETGNRLSKSLDVLLETRAAQGLIPDVTVGHALLNGTRGCLLLPFLTVEGESLQPEGAFAWQEGRSVRVNAEECMLLSLLQGTLRHGEMAWKGRRQVFSQAQSTVRLQDGKAECAVELWLTGPVPEGIAEEVSGACADLLTRASAQGVDLLFLGARDVRGCRTWTAWQERRFSEQLRSVHWEVRLELHQEM